MVKRAKPRGQLEMRDLILAAGPAGVVNLTSAVCSSGRPKRDWTVRVGDCSPADCTSAPLSHVTGTTMKQRAEIGMSGTTNAQEVLVPATPAAIQSGRVETVPAAPVFQPRWSRSK